jgi:hypothetical protein
MMFKLFGLERKPASSQRSRQSRQPSFMGSSQNNQGSNILVNAASDKIGFQGKSPKRGEQYISNLKSEESSGRAFPGGFVGLA